MQGRADHPREKYATIKQNSDLISIKRCCEILKVCRSSYYVWKNSGNQVKIDEIGVEVKKIFFDSFRTYGIRRVKKALEKENIIVSRNSVRDKFKKYGLVPKAAKKYKATTNSNHSLPLAENLLCQNFNIEKPNAVWVSDFTYIYTKHGWQYLML